MLKIIEVLKSQVGIQEDAAHTNHGDTVTQYQIAAGLPKGGGFPWCQSLLVWCSKQAYGDKSPIPVTGSVMECLAEAEKRGYKIILKADATPQNIPIGAQMIIDLGGGKGHTGMVSDGVDPHGRLFTIEGNSNTNGSRDGYEEVEQTKRTLRDNALKAFIIYDWPDAEEAEATTTPLEEQKENNGFIGSEVLDQE